MLAHLKRFKRCRLKKRHLKIYFDEPLSLLVLRLFVQMCLSLFSYAYAQLRLHPTSLYYRNCFSDTIIILPNWITILRVSNQGYIKQSVSLNMRVFLVPRIISLYKKCFHCLFEVKSKVSCF